MSTDTPLQPHAGTLLDLAVRIYPTSQHKLVRLTVPNSFWPRGYDDMPRELRNKLGGEGRSPTRDAWVLSRREDVVKVVERWHPISVRRKHELSLVLDLVRIPRAADRTEAWQRYMDWYSVPVGISI